MAAAEPPKPSAWKSFWQTVARFDSDKIAPDVALRNTIGVTIPLALGYMLHSPAAGSIAASGALNVCFSDGRDPYSKRARRMVAASFLCGSAVFLGALSGHNNLVAVALATVWAFAAGMLVSLGTAPGDLGVMSLVTLVVFAAQPMNTVEAAESGMLACAAGLVQTFLSIALWPLRRYEPERESLASLYQGLAEMAATTADPWAAPPVTSQIVEAQQTLAPLARDHSLEAERYVFLLNQAERVRLSVVTLGRLRRRMLRDPQGKEPAELLDAVLVSASDVLKSVSRSLQTGRWDTNIVRFAETAQDYSRRRWSGGSTFLNALLRDARFQVEALAGQLRAIATLTHELVTTSAESTPEIKRREQWTRRLTGSIAKLRANLSLDSTAFRHALRLAVCLGAGDAIGRMEGLRRHYWIPMTIAIVLKPDFTATFSRGILRLAGTFGGLFIATVLFHFLHAGVPAEIALIAVFVFLLRWLGPANYGILVTGISALVVLLIASTGINPNEVIAARAMNTLAGGALALAAYAIWPTWERTQTGEALAHMLETYRDYFQAVFHAFESGAVDEGAIDETRLEARLARSNAEASVDRAGAEPFMTAKQLQALKSILASAHGFVLAAMSMEAGLTQTPVVPAREASREFAKKVSATLDELARSLRNGKPPSRDLPDLREAHGAILEAVAQPGERYALVNVETDRMANSINTLAEQVARVK